MDKRKSSASGTAPTMGSWKDVVDDAQRQIEQAERRIGRLKKAQALAQEKARAGESFPGTREANDV